MRTRNPLEQHIAEQPHRPSANTSTTTTSFPSPSARRTLRRGGRSSKSKTNTTDTDTDTNTESPAKMVATRSGRKTVSPQSSPGPSTPSKALATTKNKPTAWSHAPSTATLLWMAVSLPLVIWDTIYVLGRPYTMEGGWMHVPFWIPYKLYGEVDHVYGWKAFNAGNGFTSAQGSLNLVETAMYLVYVWMYYAKATETAEVVVAAGGAKAKKALMGKDAAVALLLAFSAAVMTLSKTVLYWLNEYFSGFDNIGHNNFIDLIFLWIIPNGAWLVLPTYMIYVMGSEIIEGLSVASQGAIPIKSE